MMRGRAEVVGPLRQVGHRVDWCAVNPHFEMQVGTGRGAGAADEPDQLALLHLLADSDQYAGLVGVAGAQAGAVVDARVVAVAAALLGDLHQSDGASSRRDDGSAKRGAEVLPGVKARPRPNGSSR